MKYGSRESGASSPSASPATWRWPAGKRRWRWPRKRARRRSWRRVRSRRRLRKRPEMAKDGWKPGANTRARCCTRGIRATCSAWPRSAPDLVEQLAETGARFTHHLHRARPAPLSACRWPTTPSNGIEPSFAHHYSRRNVIREGRRRGEGGRLFVRAAGLPRTGQPGRDAPTPRTPARACPEYFIAAATTSPRRNTSTSSRRAEVGGFVHLQTANVPTDYP